MNLQNFVEALHSQIEVEPMAVVVVDDYNLVMTEVTAVVVEVVTHKSIEAVETVVAVMMVHHNWPVVEAMVVAALEEDHS